MEKQPTRRPQVLKRSRDSPLQTLFELSIHHSPLGAEVVRSQRRRSSLRGSIRLGLGPQVLPEVEEAASQVEQEEHTVHTDTQVNHRVDCRLCIGNHLFSPCSCLRGGHQAGLNGPRAFRDWIHAWSIDGIAHGAVGKAKGGITRHLAPDLLARWSLNQSLKTSANGKSYLTMPGLDPHACRGKLRMDLRLFAAELPQGTSRSLHVLATWCCSLLYGDKLWAHPV